MFASMRRFAADAMIDSLVRTAIFLSRVVSTELWPAGPDPMRSAHTRKDTAWTMSGHPNPSRSGLRRGPHLLRNFFS